MSGPELLRNHLVPLFPPEEEHREIQTTVLPDGREVVVKSQSVRIQDNEDKLIVTNSVRRGSFDCGDPMLSLAEELEIFKDAKPRRLPAVCMICRHYNCSRCSDISCRICDPDGTRFFTHCDGCRKRCGRCCLDCIHEYAFGKLTCRPLCVDCQTAKTTEQPKLTATPEKPSQEPGIPSASPAPPLRDETPAHRLWINLVPVPDDSTEPSPIRPNPRIWDVFPEPRQPDKPTPPASTPTPPPPTPLPQAPPQPPRTPILTVIAPVPPPPQPAPVAPIAPTSVYPPMSSSETVLMCTYFAALFFTVVVSPVLALTVYHNSLRVVTPLLLAGAIVATCIGSMLTGRDEIDGAHAVAVIVGTIIDLLIIASLFSAASFMDLSIPR